MVENNSELVSGIRPFHDGSVDHRRNNPPAVPLLSNEDMNMAIVARWNLWLGWGHDDFRRADTTGGHGDLLTVEGNNLSGKNG